tara:strand:+ start:6682 stop:7788 length:1107 start_codon:yes stop_codon:yes gene_type:complete
MTYIPKSQLAVKSAKPGEFQIQSSGKPYVGYYIETSKGVRYAGANNIQVGPIIIPAIEPSTKEQGNNMDIKKFNIMKKDIKKFLSNTSPLPSIKRYPSESDYNNGFFKRYFSRRINGMGYQEVDKEVYDGIKGKNKKYDYNLYEVGNIRWSLKGNVFKLNTLTIKESERKYKNISYLFPIFDEFAKDPFQNQENLYTEGGELYYGGGTEYIGAYHIHTTKGPMVGAYHTEVTHPKLYYTSELPTPPNMSYEDFMEGYTPLTQPNPTQPIIPNPPNKPSDPPTVSSNGDRGASNQFAEESYNCVLDWGPAPPGFNGLILATSENNPDGLVVVGATCVDPQDGTGEYTWPTHGNRFAQVCFNSCVVANSG